MTEHKRNDTCKGAVEDSRSANEVIESQDNDNERDVDRDLDSFINLLRNSPNGKLGNKRLRQSLKWDGSEKDRARYWETHGRALDSGLILSGKGKGGSVHFVAENESDLRQTLSDPEQDPSSSAERNLYPGALTVIRNAWVKSANYDEYLIEKTAEKGRASTGGKWSRPDISVLAVKSFQYLPGRQFDIVTFEIKPEQQISVEGVFEALSHQQFASKSYVIFHFPTLSENGLFVEEQTHGERIVGTARKHGIGIIVATQIDDWESWDELVPAERHTPDPEQANRFIATCFSALTKEKIIKWHK